MVIVERKVGGVTAAALSRFATRARKAVGLTADANILITSSEVLRDLNRRFRKKDKATDVLSFPSALEGFAGDIAISADIARENGEQLGHGAATELRILILHGLLHLAGYDHEKDEGKMQRKERRLRADLKLPEGLIERNMGVKIPKSAKTPIMRRKKSAAVSPGPRSRKR